MGENRRGVGGGAGILAATCLAKFLIDKLHKNHPWQYAVISLSFTGVRGNVGGY